MKRKQGFTLIELLLYVAIIGAIILSVSGFLSLIMSSRIKNQAIAEVEQQGIQVMQTLTQTIRNASTISIPYDISDLINSRVTVSNLTFSNLSRPGTPGTVRIQFTLTHINPEGRQEYNFSKTFYDTATLR